MPQRRRLEVVRTVSVRRQKYMLLVLSIPCLVFFFIGASVRKQTRIFHRESQSSGDTSHDRRFRDVFRASATSSCHDMRPKQRRKAVIIVAVMRSGSSFLGEFFNQHSEVYYLFEPLHGIGYGTNSSAKRKELLHDLLKCNYNRVHKHYENATDDEWSKCSHNICFKDRSKFLWRSSDLCQKAPPYCGGYKLDPYTLGIVCRRSLFPAIKTIRVLRLKDLESILVDPEIDLRVIQLVRDPRAIVCSRMKERKFVDDPLTFVKNVVRLCDSMNENVKYAERCIFRRSATQISEGIACSDAVSKLWKGRFMRISHEYLSQKPFEAWRDLYSFTELNYDSEVFEWIKGHTTKNTPKSPRKKKAPGDYYGTSRNSTEVLNAWRREISLDTVRSIQATCKPAIKALGYSLIENYDQQMNLTLPLFNLDTSVKVSWSRVT